MRGPDHKLLALRDQGYTIASIAQKFSIPYAECVRRIRHARRMQLQQKNEEFEAPLRRPVRQ
jgi:hypothetical protein